MQVYVLFLNDRMLMGYKDEAVANGHKDRLQAEADAKGYGIQCYHVKALVIAD